MILREIMNTQIRELERMRKALSYYRSREFATMTGDMKVVLDDSLALTQPEPQGVYEPKYGGTSR